jgi:peptidoglycan LD-endopeptidase CwlK
MLDPVSEKRLAAVHPELAMRVRTLIQHLRTQSFDIRVVQGLRTYAEQDALFAQGRTKPGQVVTNARGGFSNHNFGLACDLCPFKAGNPQWSDNVGFLAIGKAADLVHLNWGGHWFKLIDKPHVELAAGLTLAECRDLYDKGGLQAVWDAAKIEPFKPA